MGVATNLLPRILIVEDSDKKFEVIAECVAEAMPNAVISRAPTMREAERAIEAENWALVILDISLDIAPSLHGARGRGQANIGGVSLAEKMFLLGREFPTIVVTAFDSFATANIGRVTNEIMGFEDVAARVKSFLPNHLICCLRYNARNWRSDMTAGITKALSA